MRWILEHSPKTRVRRRSLLASIATLLTLASSAIVSAQEAPPLVGGRNVNMAGGSQILSLKPFDIRGDVLGRAQNEPSCAISTRNPQHVLCGANDYRMVDVPGVSQTQLIRDAWLGEFQSADGGDTWESTLYGGFFLDPAFHPLSLLKFRAAADPVVRSGLAGVAFYTGIAFTTDKSRSALHLTTYLDLNNSENDDMPFKVVRTSVVAQARSPQFIDKPWMYVEAGPEGDTCVLPVANDRKPNWTQTRLGKLLVGWLVKRWPNWQPRSFTIQRVPASIVHIVYTAFLDLNDSTAAIMYTRSNNCGLTFTTPVRLNPTAEPSVGLDEHGNGAAVAKALATGARTVMTTWRRVRQPTAKTPVTDAIMGAYSTNNGTTWSAPFVVEEICPYDQGTTNTSFRTTSFPTMTADATGRFYVAWADRRAADGTCAVTATGAPIGAARIRVATSTNLRNWSPSVAVPSDTPEHQIQPSIVFTAGRLFLAWVDFRADASQTFGQYVNEAEVLLNSPAIRHTGDVRASMAAPGQFPNFAQGAVQISEYLKGVYTVNGTRVVGQLQWNAVNRRWARKGTVPFYGDYIDIATMPYLAPDRSAGRRTWTPNNQTTQNTPLGPVPFAPNLLVAWSDNRDMRAAPGVDNNPAVAVPYNTPAGLNLPAMSVYDPTQTRPVCTVPSEAYTTGTTNQNTYTARLSVGFVAAAPGNNKSLGALQRAFVVFVRNDTGLIKTFQLAASPPPGGRATFDQFDPSRQVQEVNVPARSSVARTVYVSDDPANSTPLAADASVRVDVIEVVAGVPVLASSVLLNSDPSAPEIDSPEIDSREIFTPEIDSPEIDSRGFQSPEIDSPEIDSPEIDSPEIDSATWRALGLGSPEIDSPEIDSPEIDSPEIDSPEIDSPEIDSAAITDARFRIRNAGNTTGQYNAKAFVTPTPGSDFRYQVIVRRTYDLPAVDSNCRPTTIKVTKVAVNLSDVQVGTPEIDSPEIDSSAPGTASFHLGPGEQAEVIVRTRSPRGLTLTAEAFNLAAQQEAVNSDDAAQGITEPPVFTTYLTVATPALPPARVGTPFNTTLLATGGADPVTWTLIAGALPSPLILTASGQIVGTPTTSGSYPFTVRATDATVPGQTAEREFTISVTTPGQASLAFITQPSDTPVGAAISPAVSVRAVNAAGTVVAGVPVTLQLVGAGALSGVLTRTTGPNGVAVFTGLSINTQATPLQLLATASGFASATSSTFNGTLPDLVVSSFTHSPANPTTADTITFTAVVTNIGAASASASTLMFDIGGETSGAPSTLFPVPALAPGASFTVQRQQSLPAGAFLNAAVADFTGQVTESNEGDNTASDSYSVQAPNAALAFSAQPTTTAVGQVMPPITVLATDAAAQPIAGVAVTLSLIGSGTLSGTTTRTTGPTGLAVFNDLSVDTLGAGKALQATATNYPAVTSGTFDTVTNIGQIAGTVTSLASGALAGAAVQIIGRFGAVVATATTAADGTYLTVTLPSGTYYARTSNVAGHVNTAYGCPNVVCAVLAGAPITIVGGGAIVGGVDINLQALGGISGTVFSNTGAPRAGSTMSAVNADLVATSLVNVLPTTTSAADGTYTLSLPAGRYYVRSSGNGLIPRVYDALTCVGCLISDGVAVTVTAGVITEGIDFTHQPGGQIIGMITDAATGLPVNGVNVQIFTATGELVGAFVTSANGPYRSAGLSDGQYYVKTFNTQGYIDELYGNFPCAIGCAITTGTPVTIANGITVNANLALARGGQIRGTVTDAVTGDPISTVIQVYSAHNQLVTNIGSNASGLYVTQALPNGTYYVKSSGPSGYIDELYGDVPCLVVAVPGQPDSPQVCDVTTGTPVVVVGGADATEIDVALSQGGFVSGRVTNELTGAPVAGIAQSGFSGLGSVVGIFDPNGNLVAQSSTDQDGRFITSRGLPTGQYYAKTFTRGVTIDEVYGGESCLGDLCNVLTGTPISVTAGSITRGVDFALAVGGTINATILSAGTGVPAAATMSVYTAAGQVVSTAVIPTAGLAPSRGLPPGNYFAATTDIPSTLLQPFSVDGSFVHEVYDNINCLPGCPVTTAGTPIQLAANQAVPITFTLERELGRIMGYVTDAATGALLGGVPVEIYSAGGTLLTTVTSRSASEFYFTTPGLAAGTYYLRTRNAFGYQDVLYNGLSCVGNCDVTLGTPVTVVDGQPTAGIVLALPLANSTQPLLTISATDAAAAETTNPGTFTVTRTGSTSGPLVVNYAIGGTATNGLDYTALPGTITIPAGASSATISVAPIDDAFFEPTETVIVTLTQDEGYEIAAPGEAVVTIAGDSGDTQMVVRNTNDSGAESLRQALLDANLAPDLNVIRFDIPGAGPHTIQPLTALPTVTSPIDLDGRTQPGFSGAPIVELSGALAGPAATGLDLQGGNSTVRGLVINRWSLSGIALTSPTNVGNNVIAGNYIGTDVAGGGGAPSTLEQQTNTYIHNPTANRVGVLVSSPNNRIGGTTLADRNLISGNSEWGLAISVQTAADGVTVLGSGAGAVVQGNYFGTDVTGSVAKPNGAVRTNGGIPNALFTGSILVQAPNVTIGGVTAGAGNVISANATGIVAGPRFTPGTFALISDGSSLTVQGNMIGTNAAGTAALPFNTDVSTFPTASRGTGIQISSPGGVIGGSAAGAFNVISGNASYGINATSNVQNGGSGGVLVSSAANLTVQGNRIGTNLAGTAPIVGSGGVAGINLNAANAHIGGTAVGAGNIISGNSGHGIQLASFAIPPVVVTASNALIENNWIGLSASGAAAVPNGATGILVNSVPSVVVRNNIISGNLAHGIQLANSATTLGSIRGNWIGVGSNGTTAIGNASHGVIISNQASNNTIGGTNAGDGNVISGNLLGVTMESNSSGNFVRGNFIGTTTAGTAALGNSTGGILLTTGATNNVIGGTTAAARNIISGNVGHGISLSSSASSGNQITGNYIGTNATGTAAIPNTLWGITIATSNTVVGGTTPGAGNVISGNGDPSSIQAGGGVLIFSGLGSNVVQGNFIGTNATGTAALGNKTRGIDISSSNNIIGGTTAAARNIISGNGTGGGGAGVGVFSPGTNNQIQGNYIGTDVTGVFPIPNSFGGVLVRAANTVVGGLAAGAGNRIAFNTNAAGVSVLDDGANSPILGNRIFSNGGLGIDLAVGVTTNGVTVNDAGDSDVGPNDLQNFPVITSATTTTASGTLNSTPNTTFTIQLFVSVTCDPSGFGEGDTPIATFNVTTDGTGLGNFAQGGLALDNGQIITATATNPGGSTSEFSACATVGGAVLTGTVLDASGDVSLSLLADVVRGTVTVQGGNVTLSIRYTPTFDAFEGAAQFVIDTDENPATGNQGSDSLCVADNGVIGAEYLVDFGPGSTASILHGGDGTQASVLPFVGPACNSFGTPTLTAPGSVTEVFDDDFVLIGMDVTFPLSMFGSDDGRLRFKVLTYNHIPGNTFTGILDRATEIGQPAGQVQ